MESIKVNSLVKYYQVYKKTPGLKGSIKSFFKRESEEVRAVDNVSFNINEGELVGFIGPNGAGKTTTLKCLSGLLHPTSGGISVLGFEPKGRKEEFLKNISMVMGQKNQLWWDLPPIETFNLNKDIYEIPSKKFEENLKYLTEVLSVGDILRTQVRKLSLGQRMKCELIAALLHDPKVLFLDEPTIGLDVVSQKAIQDFVRDYNKTKKATIMLTSHNMNDVKQLCERVIIINKGKLIFDGSLKEVVSRFVDYKTITVVFSSQIDVSKLEKIGKVESYNFPQAVILTKRGITSSAASELLQNFPVADLNIEEVPIEEVIRAIFTQENVV